jgi:hypothetical protein
MVNVADHTVSHRIVVVAGAGASRALADPPMPLMTDWISSLVTDLQAEDSFLPSVIGLGADLSGEDIEARLGDFLAFEAGLDLFERFKPLGYTSIAAQEMLLSQWGSKARERCRQVVGIIHRNLYDSFGSKRLDRQRAKSAYEGLRSVLIDAGAPVPAVAFATTNYDCAIEIAFQMLGSKVLDGFRPEGYGTPYFDPLGIAEEALQANGVVPVLHLHGAVGWYREPDGRIARYPADQPYNPTLGVPALLLPDSRKTTGSLPGAERVWREFDSLLREATHLLFVGHSLNDRYLIDRIGAHRKPTAVAWWFSSPTLPQSEIDLITAHVDTRLPGAFIVPAEFGPSPYFHPGQLAAWLS